MHISDLLIFFPIMIFLKVVALSEPLDEEEFRRHGKVEVSHGV